MKAIKILLIFLLTSLSFLSGQNKNTETFEGEYFPPKNWIVKYENSRPTEANFMRITDEKKDGGSGHSFRFASADATQGEPYRQYLISPELDVDETDTITFRYLVPAYGSRYFRVGWSSTGTDVTDDFTWTEQITATDLFGYGEEYWSTYRNNAIPAGTKYICIQYDASSAGVNTYFYIDNVSFPQVKETGLPLPANLMRNAETGTFSWTETGTAEKWELIIGESIGFDPGQAIPLPTDRKEYTPENLIPLTYYIVHVRSVSGTEHSPWSAPFFFRSGCPEFYASPWQEGFEKILAENLLPDCQSITDPSLFETKQGAVDWDFFLNRKPHTGNNFASFKSKTGMEITPTRNWYFSPCLELKKDQEYQVSLWYITDEDEGFDTLAIALGSNPEAADMQIIALHEKPHSGYYKELRGYYTPQEDQKLYAGIYYSAGFSYLSPQLQGTYLSIDDFSVTPIGTMPQAENLLPIADPQHAQQIRLSWTEKTAASTRIISIGRHGIPFDPADSVLNAIIDRTEYTVTGDSKGNELRPNTEYDLYIQLQDDNGQKSEWTGPLSVKTGKTILELPVGEDFSSLEERDVLPENIYWISHLGARMRTATSNSSYYNQEGRNDSKYTYWNFPSTNGQVSQEWIIMRGISAVSGNAYDFSAWMLANGKDGIDSVEFRVGNSPDPAAMTEVILCITDLKETSYKLFKGTYVSQSNEPLFFGIRLKGHSIGYSSASLCIDDISIEAASDCSQPYDLSISELLDNQARISWIGSASEWKIAVGEGNTVDTENPTTLHEWQQTESAFDIPDLESHTYYTVAVQGVCDETPSKWSDPITFRTLCSAFSEFPLSENFEDFDNGCWKTEGTRYGNPDPTIKWDIIDKQNVSIYTDNVPFSGNKALRYRTSFNNEAEIADLISPELDMGNKTKSGLEFYWWNKDRCDNSENPLGFLYIQAKKDLDYITVDSIRLCGCTTGIEGYQRYQLILDYPVTGYKLTTQGNSMYANSNTLLDSLSIDAFDLEDIPTISELQAVTSKNHIRLTWSAPPKETSPFMEFACYTIRRNGEEIARTTENAYTDSALAKGLYQYEIAYVTVAGLASEPISVQGEVSVPTFEVKIEKTGAAGYISPEEGVRQYAEGEILSLRASAIEKETVFLGWIITPDTIREAYTEILIDKNLHIKALFAELTYPVIIATQGEGSVDPQAGIHYFKGGDSVLLSASPKNDYWLFEKWIINGDSSSYMLPELKLPINDTIRATAIFKQLSYTLTISINGSGTTSPEEGRHSIPAGDSVKLSAVPMPGNRFVKWNISSNSVAEPDYAFVMERATTVTAYFEEAVSYTVTVSQQGEGSISPQAGTHTYYEGDTLHLSAQAAEGWTFDCWIVGNDSIKTRQHKTAVTSDLSVKAVFSEIPPVLYTLALSKEGEGEIEPKEGIYSYPEGEKVSIEAKASDNWEFAYWLINGQQDKQAKTELTMTADILASAVFLPKAGIQNNSRILVEVYPNPARQKLYLRTEGFIPTQWEFFNLTGRSVLRESISEKTPEIDISALPAGMYLVKITGNNHESRIVRLVKK